MLRVASASLIEGRLRRRSRWRSEAWRPAAEARNRQPREVRDPVRQALRPGREELAARIRRKCRRWKHGPRPKIATVERREARVPPLRGARRLASAWRAASRARRGAASWHPASLGAPPPLVGWRRKSQTPGAPRRGNETGCLTS